MFNEAEFTPIFEATRAFLHYVLFDDSAPPAAESLTLVVAAKFGAAHGVGDAAAARVIFSLACFAIDRRGAALWELRDTLLAAAVARHPDEVMQ